jgi:hypothetical protein
MCRQYNSCMWECSTTIARWFALHHARQQPELLHFSMYCSTKWICQFVLPCPKQQITGFQSTGEWNCPDQVYRKVNNEIVTGHAFHLRQEYLLNFFFLFPVMQWQLLSRKCTRLLQTKYLTVLLSAWTKLRPFPFMYQGTCGLAIQLRFWINQYPKVNNLLQYIIT